MPNLITSRIIKDSLHAIGGFVCGGLLLTISSCGGNTNISSTMSSQISKNVTAPVDRGTLTITAHESRVTIYANSVPLKRVLTRLAELTGIVVSGDLRGEPISMRFRDVALEPAIAKILGKRSYVLEITHATIAPMMLHVLPVGQIHSTELQAALEDSNVRNRVESVSRVNGQFAPGETEGLATALNDQELSVRVQAVDALETFDPQHEGTMALLERALVDASPEVRLAAVGLLPDIGGEQSVPALTIALHDPELTIREEAVFALSAFRGNDATNALRFALDDPDPGIREIATILLTASDRGRPQ